MKNFKIFKEGESSTVLDNIHSVTIALIFNEEVTHRRRRVSDSISLPLSIPYTYTHVI